MFKLSDKGQLRKYITHYFTLYIENGSQMITNTI